jgi:hypothetical protein
VVSGPLSGGGAGGRRWGGVRAGVEWVPGGAAPSGPGRGAVGAGWAPGPRWIGAGGGVQAVGWELGGRALPRTPTKALGGPAPGVLGGRPTRGMLRRGRWVGTAAPERGRRAGSRGTLSGVGWPRVLGGLPGHLRGALGQAGGAEEVAADCEGGALNRRGGRGGDPDRAVGGLRGRGLGVKGTGGDPGLAPAASSAAASGTAASACSRGDLLSRRPRPGAVDGG